MSQSPRESSDAEPDALSALGRCPVCLLGPPMPRPALFDACLHCVCMECALRWAAVSENRCPLCRQQSAALLYYAETGAAPVLRRLRIPTVAAEAHVDAPHPLESAPHWGAPVVEVAEPPAWDELAGAENYHALLVPRAAVSGTDPLLALRVRRRLYETDVWTAPVGQDRARARPDRAVLRAFVLRELSAALLVEGLGSTADLIVAAVADGDVAADSALFDLLGDDDWPHLRHEANTFADSGYLSVAEYDRVMRCALFA